VSQATCQADRHDRRVGLSVGDEHGEVEVAWGRSLDIGPSWGDRDRLVAEYPLRT
jgi:hypothetical protein